MRAGWKTTEFWVAAIAILFNTIGKQLGGWPEFPQEALIALTTWIGARVSEKTWTQVDPATGKRAWETSEFWSAVGFALIKYFFPNAPEWLLAPVLALVAGRPLVKIFDGFDLKNLFKKNQ